MVNYQQGKIYKIVCNTSGLVYIGSTCQKLLSQRLSEHVSNYKQYLIQKKNYISSYEVIEYGNYEIILVENCPCNTRDELYMRERFYIENQECINMVNPIRFKEDNMQYNKKYYQENQEKRKLQRKKYREENKEKEKIYYQKYHEKNKEIRNLASMKYREENKEKIKLLYKKYYEENHEKEKIRHIKYHEENKDKVKTFSENYRNTNRDSINFKQREKRRIKSIYLEQLKYYNL